ncbi:uncharacterized protein LOC116848844 isoform X2 [Odontomachus brunneus]|uniref:uncharacterized protein LOC116848844 isoform X2 n=1 Tax=Odontomachus brunneus TaxID=486640 RepID=UPI0013F28081|nr:uncharacterized protein LOC116848844 isoform X2 [Odontomachus brunneus]
MNKRNLLLVLLILSTATSARCGLLEMSQTLWTKVVSGSLTKIGKLDPLRVPLIKVDQSEGDTSYRIILRNLEIVGLNESTLESIHVARGGLKSNLSELEAGYVSYSDLRDVESVKYKFHTMMREPHVPKDSLEAVVSPSSRAAGVRASSQEDRFGRLQQDQHRFSTFEQSQQHDRQTFSHPDTMLGGPHRDNLRTHGNSETGPGNFASFQHPAYVQPAYTRGTGDFQGDYRGSLQGGEDVVDCDDARGPQYHYQGNQKANRHYEPRQGYAEVSASEAVKTKSKDRGDARASASYNREQSARSDNRRASEEETKRQSGYIDIVYAGDRANGSMRRFGNFGVNPGQDQRVYGIEDIMKDIRESARFIIHNFTEGEALTKRNDMIKVATGSKELKDSMRYAKDHQEQQGYFEEGMQLIYHYGGVGVINGSASRDVKLNDTKRAKRAHPEETAEDDVMHVILRIRVPLLRVRSQYTLAGKAGKEMLRGSGLLAGNFTDLAGDFMLELKRVNGELMIVRAARAKLMAKDKKVTFQGMDEEGPVRAVLDHGLMAAEAVAAMLADDFATKGLSEKTADAVIYRMYKDLPGN